MHGSVARRRGPVLVAAALAGMAASVATPAFAKDAPRWVEVTRPMLGCEAYEPANYPLAKARMLKLAPTWRAGQELPKGCEVIEPGTRLVHARKQPSDAVELWGYCGPGCSPYLWPIYTPLPKAVGAYFKPTTKPAWAKVEDSLLP